MTEFWKSQAKKHCDICNCWLSDQKASRELHEQGKRHQENVQRRLGDARKKTKEQDVARRQQSSVIEVMERAAAASMLKDLRENPELRGKFGLSAEEEAALTRKAENEAERREKEAEREAEKQRLSAFIESKLKGTPATDEKTKQNPEQPAPSTSESSGSSSTKIKFRTPKAAPQPQTSAQSHPFGSWMPANTEKQKTAAPVDLQLPKARDATMQSRLRDAQEVKSALLNAESMQQVALIESGAKRTAAAASGLNEATSTNEGPVAFKRAKAHADVKPKQETS